MRLICPSCGAMHSADAWHKDEQAREALALAVGMPPEVKAPCLAYLALFRPQGGKQGLRWSRVRKLLMEIKALVERPYVQSGQRVGRPATAGIWGAAMQRMVDCPPPSLPMRNHNYLIAVAYDLADAADRQVEVARNAAERRGDLKAVRASKDELEPISMEELAEIRANNMRKS